MSAECLYDRVMGYVENGSAATAAMDGVDPDERRLALEILSLRERPSWEDGYDRAVSLVGHAAVMLDDVSADRARTLRGLVRTLTTVRDDITITVPAPASSGGER